MAKQDCDKSEKEKTRKLCLPKSMKNHCRRHLNFALKMKRKKINRMECLVVEIKQIEIYTTAPQNKIQTKCS